MRKTVILIILFVLLAISFYAFYWVAATKWKKVPVQITDIKMASAIDDNLMPVQTINSLPKGCSKVYCWFKWRNAKVKTVVLAKWKFVTDEISILDKVIVIPRKDGMGSVSLVMPEGKVFPSGEYQVDLVLGDYKLRSCSFIVP